MSTPSEQAPFATLGDKIKLMRKRHKETIAEAAGAVEIAEEELKQIERGQVRPSEEILMLLISHFGINEDDAVQLWELAGYDNSAEQDDHRPDSKTIVMTIALDPRVMYSDSVHIAGSQHGVVLSFLQPGIGNGMNALPISRIGMGREQARKVLGLLKDTLDALDTTDRPPKQLPPSTYGDSSY